MPSVFASSCCDTPGDLASIRRIPAWYGANPSGFSRSPKRCAACAPTCASKKLARPPRYSFPLFIGCIVTLLYFIIIKVCNHIGGRHELPLIRPLSRSPSRLRGPRLRRPVLLRALPGHDIWGNALFPAAYRISRRNGGVFLEPADSRAALRLFSVWRRDSSRNLCCDWRQPIAIPRRSCGRHHHRPVRRVRDLHRHCFRARLSFGYVVPRHLPRPHPASRALSNLVRHRWPRLLCPLRHIHRRHRRNRRTHAPHPTLADVVRDRHRRLRRAELVRNAEHQISSADPAHLFPWISLDDPRRLQTTARCADRTHRMTASEIPTPGKAFVRAILLSIAIAIAIGTIAYFALRFTPLAPATRLHLTVLLVYCSLFAGLCVPFRRSGAADRVPTQRHPQGPPRHRCLDRHSRRHCARLLLPRIRFRQSS